MGLSEDLKAILRFDFKKKKTIFRKNDLLNCPFCGSHNLRTDPSWVYCCECQGIGPTGKSKESGKKLWNARAKCKT